MASGSCGNEFKSVIFKHILQIRFMSISSEISHVNATEHLSWQVNVCQVMVWCTRQQDINLANIYPDLCCHIVTRPQWRSTYCYDFDKKNGICCRLCWFSSHLISFAIHKLSFILNHDDVTGVRFMLQLESLSFFATLVLPSKWLCGNFCMYSLIPYCT